MKKVFRSFPCFCSRLIVSLHYETLHAVHITPVSHPLPDGRMWRAERDAQPSGGGGQHRGQPGTEIKVGTKVIINKREEEEEE